MRDGQPPRKGHFVEDGDHFSVVVDPILTPAPEVEVLPDGRRLEYPQLTKDEKFMLRVLSKGLFISRYSLSWGYVEARDGKPDRLHKLVRRIVRLKPLEVMIDDSEGEGTEAGVHEAVPGETS